MFLYARVDKLKKKNSSFEHSPVQARDRRPTNERFKSLRVPGRDTVRVERRSCIKRKKARWLCSATTRRYATSSKKSGMLDIVFHKFTRDRWFLQIPRKWPLNYVATITPTDSKYNETWQNDLFRSFNLSSSVTTVHCTRCRLPHFVIFLGDTSFARSKEFESKFNARCDKV